MGLSELTEFQDRKRKEFEKAVSRKAKKLSFADIIKEIHLDTWNFVNRNWEDGQKLEFFLSQGNYSVIVWRDSLVLMGNYGIEIARFAGNEIKEYYESLSTTILKAKQEYLENLPF